MLSKYFYKKYADDLAVFISCAKKEEVPDYLGRTLTFFGGINGEYIERDSRVIPEEDRADFLFSMFMMILMDQSIYTFAEKKKIKIYESLSMSETSCYKLGGNGFGPCGINPFFVLYMADEKSQQKMREEMKENVEFLISETIRFFEQSPLFDKKEFFRFILQNPAYLLAERGNQRALPEFKDNETIKLFKQEFEKQLKEIIE